MLTAHIRARPVPGVQQNQDRKGVVETRVAIAAAGDLLLDAIQRELQDITGVECSGVRSIPELLTRIQSGQVDAVILDDQFEQTTWIGNVVTALKKICPRIGIIVIGTFADGGLIYELFESGIAGYLYRGDELRPLLEPALRSVHANRLYLSPTASSEYSSTVQSGRCRQWQLDADTKAVLRLMAAGLSVTEISAALGIKTRRVYWLRTKLRHRFNAATNESVIVAAGLQGYLRLDSDFGL